MPPICRTTPLLSINKTKECPKQWPVFPTHTHFVSCSCRLVLLVPQTPLPESPRDTAVLCSTDLLCSTDVLVLNKP